MTPSSATLIDHIFVNNPHKVSKSAILTLDISDHLATYVTLLFDENFHHSPSSSTINSNFSKMSPTNLEQFRDKIINTDWSTVNAKKTANEKFNKFSELYNNVYKEVFTNRENINKNRKSKPRRDTKPWILPWLQDACERKNKLYREYIKIPTVQNKTKYTKMRKFVDKHLKRQNTNITLHTSNNMLVTAANNGP